MISLMPPSLPGLTPWSIIESPAITEWFRRPRSRKRRIRNKWKKQAANHRPARVFYVDKAKRTVIVHPHFAAQVRRQFERAQATFRDLVGDSVPSL